MQGSETHSAECVVGARERSVCKRGVAEARGRQQVTSPQERERDNRLRALNSVMGAAGERAAWRVAPFLAGIGVEERCAEKLPAEMMSILNSHNVLIKLFYKVNYPTKPSTYCAD